MESVKLNLEYDSLLQKTKLSSNNIERENSRFVQSINHVYFVICNSCFWCASYFGVNDLNSSSQVLRCHLCNSLNTELIPITSNETFKINYNVTQGMKMEFYRNNEIVNRQEFPEQQIVPIHF